MKVPETFSIRACPAGIDRGAQAPPLGMVWLFFAVLLASLILDPALICAGTVHAIDGRIAIGTIEIEATRLTVRSKDGIVTQVYTGDILEADFAQSGETSAMKCGVMLANGGIIAADSIISIDQKIVRIARGEQTMDIPLTQIARIIFRPVPRSLWPKIKTGRAGAVLDNGDYLEGQMKSFSGHTLTMSSLLFGISDFDTDTQALAVVLREIHPTPSNWVLSLADGTVVPAHTIDLMEKELVAEDADGRLIWQGPASAMLQLRMGMKPLKCLADAPPDSVDSMTDSAYLLNAVLTPGIAMRLRGASITKGISQAAGTSLTYSIPAGYRALVGRVGVPADMPPYTKVRFVVQADGQTKYKSSDLCSADEAAFLNVQLESAKQITLKVESILPSDLGAIGLWGDIAIVPEAAHPTTEP
jgi:hypothetical protein